MIRARWHQSLGIAIAALLIGTSPARAEPTHIVSINKCDPIPPQTTVHYSGYTPAYYNSAFYGDVYGYRYRPYPLAGTATTHTTGGSLNIDYVNVTEKPLKSIEFGLVAKGVVVAEVRDVGTFSHGAEIKHSFGLNPNVFPLGTGLAQCVPLRATYHDGTTWKNPKLPHANPGLYR